MNNLENVKVGDYLIISKSYGNRNILAKVIRTTNTLVVTKTYKFRKTNGYEYGGMASARIATEKDIKAAKANTERNNLIYRCAKIDFKTLPNEKLTEILAIVEKK